MAQRLFGVETEYAFSALVGKRAHPDVKSVVERFVSLAKKQMPHLPNYSGSGMFWQNGSRFYVDCGLHPELGTPECADPWELVRYILAGERILARLAQQLESSGPEGLQVLLFRGNVDYSGAQSTWGCHESYLHRADPELLPKQIIPHLVSRVIYTGAGGFDPLSPGLLFTLSPRATHLVRVVSSQSTSDRGIFHTKDESLSGQGYHRLHILCGESLCSETAMWLKVGATALVVAMTEAGLRPGETLELRSPLRALRSFAGDPRGRAVAELVYGLPQSGVWIQRQYLAQAEAHVRAAFMPPWAGEVCRAWRAMLDRLEQAPDAAATCLDWAIKRALYVQRAQRRGFAWESVPYWTHLLAQLVEALAHTEYRNKPVSVEFVIGKTSPVASQVKVLEPYVREHDLSWEGLKAFLNLRQELFEIDMQFGRLGDQGIFAALDRASVLAHRQPGLGDVEAAVACPPAIGRARLRGEFIRRLAGNNAGLLCDWQGVWDSRSKRVLDLSEPFENQERWRDVPEDLLSPESPGSLGELLGVLDLWSPVQRTRQPGPQP